MDTIAANQAYDQGCQEHDAGRKLSAAEFLHELIETGITKGWWPDNNAAIAERFHTHINVIWRIRAKLYDDIAREKLFNIARLRGWRDDDFDMAKRLSILTTLASPTVNNRNPCFQNVDVDKASQLIDRFGVIPPIARSDPKEFEHYIKSQHRAVPTISLDTLSFALFYLNIRPFFSGYPDYLIRKAHERWTKAQAECFEDLVELLGRLKLEASAALSKAEKKFGKKPLNDLRGDIMIEISDKLSDVRRINSSSVLYILRQHNLTLDDLCNRTHGELCELSKLTHPFVANLLQHNGRPTP